MRAASTVVVAAAMASMVVAAVNLVRGDLIAAALGGAVALAYMRSWRSLLIVVAVAALLSEPVVAALGSVIVLGHAAIPLQYWFGRRAALDPAALPTTDSLPAALAAALAANAEGPALTTRDMVLTAARERPERWRTLLGRDPGADSFDGPLHPTRPVACTQYAAEAIGLADELSRELGRRLDANLLGVAATCVPLSSASEWVTDRGVVAEQIVKAQAAQVAAAGTAFQRTPAGADWLRRLELDIATTRVRRSLLAADVAPSREWLATRPRRTALLFHTLARFSLIAALALHLVKVPRSLLRWTGTVNAPAEAATAAAPGERPAAHAKPAAPAPPRSPRARRLRAAAGRGAGRIRRLLRPWRGWPAPAWIGWVVVRPALLAAAIVLAATIGGAGLVGALVVVAAALLRSLRRPWLAPLVAAGVAAVVPAAAAVLLARALVGELSLLGLGGRRPDTPGSVAARRSRGLDRVVSARLAIVWAPVGSRPRGVDVARAELATAVRQGDDEEALDRAAACILAALGEGRADVLLRSVTTFANGFLFARWSGAQEHHGVMAELRRLMVFEGGTQFAVRAVATLAASVTAALAVATVDGLVGGSPTLQRIAAGTAAALIALPLTARRISVATVLVASTAAFALTGPSAVWKVVPIAVACGYVAHVVRLRASRLVVAGRRRWQEWPIPKGLPGPLRGHWRAAAQASAAGRQPVAVQTLLELATAPGLAAEHRAAALGRAALIELERGRLKEAESLLRRIGAGELAGTAAVATGMLSAELGDLPRAESALRAALATLDARSALRPKATLALSDVLARSGRPQESSRLVADLRGQPLAMRGLDGLVETEVAIAAAAAAAGDFAGALARLDELTDMAEPDGEVIAVGSEEAARFNRTQGRALLLRGQLLLERGEVADAARALEQAVALAGSAGEDALRATSMTLFGAALAFTGRASAAVDAIDGGVDELERRRTQLRAADRRTAMIVARDSLYRQALSGLVRAGRDGEPRAGLVAAKLIESLRSSALAATLRAGELPLQQETKAMLARLDAGQPIGEAPDAVRERLAGEISREFADAYLPSAMTIGEIERLAGRLGHVLTFYASPDGLPAWRAWISPQGRAEIDQVPSDVVEQETLACLTSPSGFSDGRLHVPVRMRAAELERLGRALLPAGLRSTLEGPHHGRPPRVVIVPAGPLAYVPWSALHVGGRPVVERAVLQLVPALELVGAPRLQRRSRSRRVVAHLHRRDSGELGALSDRDAVELHDSRAGFTEALDSRAFDGAYFGAHGDGLGLRQAVAFADGSELSAAGALASSWPPWVLFGSCLVGRTDHVAGREPLGLAISCMLRGAETVVASVVELTERGAVAIGDELSADLFDGDDPAEALRDAQLAYLRRVRLARVPDCLGLVCISRVVPDS